MDNLKEKVLDILSNICDPEIPLDIVSLGLVKDIVVNDKNLKIVMTLTTPNCPLEDVIRNMVIKRVSESLPEYTINIEFDFSKPWTSENISKKGKEKLKNLGWKL